MNKSSERSARYDKTHTTGFFIKLNLSTDTDILARLAEEPNRQGYVKRLIRQDIAEKKTQS